MGADISGQATSVWMATEPGTPRAGLVGDRAFDVVVVGAGIAGLTTADFLARSGVRVAVIERGRVAAGVSGFTTAKVTSLHTLRYARLTKLFGKERAQQYGAANQWAVEHIAETVASRGIDCGFSRDRALTYAMTDSGRGEVEREASAASKLGLPAGFTESLDLPFPTRGAVCFRDQARFHPRQYLLHLADSIETHGGVVYEETVFESLKEEEGVCTVRTASGTLKADRVVIASHYPVHDDALFFARLYPHRSYAYAVEVEGPRPDGMYISAEEPERSVRRLDLDGRELLIIGGELHKTGQDPDTVARYQVLADWCRAAFPVNEFLYHWSTQDPSTPDGVPFIGRINPRTERVYVATGFDGWGMTGGTVAGRLICDQIMGRANPWAEVFDPNRNELRGAGTLVTENLNVAANIVSGIAHVPPHKNPEDIAPGEAELVTWDGKALAVHRDDHGVIHQVSCACTHMGCYVTWNSAEKSWDCPCHGSRFDPDGSVLHGPAVKGLDPHQASTPSNQ